MKKELENKLLKVLREELSENECSIIKDIIQESKENSALVESLTSKVESMETAAFRMGEHTGKADRELKVANEELKLLREENIEFKKIEKDRKVFELEVVNTAMLDTLKRMERLTQTVFKTPEKIREFTTPVVVSQYEQVYDSSGNPVHQKAGEYTSTEHQSETTGVKYDETD